tara:strand:- start:294 stop:1031 length:738 start_codon:yes stop_codon:yes gene_type:complete
MLDIICSTMDGQRPLCYDLHYLSGIRLVIVDQCNEEAFCDSGSLVVIKTKTRGLSRSRNIGINYSVSKWILFTDNDVKIDGPQLLKIINNAERIGRSDLLILAEKHNYGLSLKTDTLLNKFRLINPASWQILVSKKVILDVRFNENFGLGSGMFNSGEENIYLMDHYNLGHNIRYLNEKVIDHPDEGTGFIYDDLFYRTRINVFKVMFGKWIGGFLVLALFAKKQLTGKNVKFTKGLLFLWRERC